MPVELRPFGPGGAELGMSRAEMIEHIDALEAAQLSGVEMFFTLLFAYVAATYAAGRSLTKAQYVIGTVMYAGVMTNVLLMLLSIRTTIGFWFEYAGLRVDSSLAWFRGFSEFLFWGVALALVGLSIWFGQLTRRSPPVPASVEAAPA